MTQSNWPFEYGITGLASRAEINESAAEGSGEDPDELTNDGVLFIVEGQQLGYGDKQAWEVAH